MRQGDLDLITAISSTFIPRSFKGDRDGSGKVVKGTDLAKESSWTCMLPPAKAQLRWILQCNMLPGILSFSSLPRFAKSPWIEGVCVSVDVGI